MKRVFSWIDRMFCGTSGGRIFSPPLHPIDALLYLEWSLSNGKALAEGLSPWESRPAKDDEPPGLYEPFRAGKVLQTYGGDLASVLELFADAHSNSYGRGTREELLILTRRLGADGFVVSPDGIAVTHPRHLIVLPVPKPIVSVCIAHVPVILGPAVSVPVRIFLSVVSPTVGTQLAVLARLSRLIARDKFLGALDGRNPREMLMDLVWLHDCGLADEQIDVPKEWR